MSKVSETAEAKAKSLEFLRANLSPGDTVCGIVRSVSRSGMSRTIDFYKFSGGESIYLSGHFANVLGYHRDRRGSLRVNGCGMDMVFSCVYSASRMIFPDGFRVDGRGRNGDTSGWDKDGGYALRSEVL